MTDEKLFEDWNRGLRIGRRAQFETAKYYERLHLIIGIPAVVIKVLISVGGWTWSGGFSEMSLSRASRKKFIDSAAAFVRQHDLDGIDLDWEYPGLPGAGNPHRPQDRRNFTLLLGERRRELNITQKPAGKRYLLTIAAGASMMDTHAGGTQGPRRRISGSPMRAGW
jgi:GH18 family chitinase